MSTYLQLCQGVAEDTGVISGIQPQTVVGQTGRLRNIVDYTNEAWRDVQMLRNQWLWMRQEFSSGSAITAGTHRYTPASFGISSFTRWIEEINTVWLYDPDIGKADEGQIERIEWRNYRFTYERATHDPNRPTQYSISPQMEMCFGTFPNKQYIVSGEYMQGVQSLTEDDDVPNCPEKYHDIIKHKAVMLYDQRDEAVTALSFALQRYNELLTDIQATQLPMTELGGGPIA